MNVEKGCAGYINRRKKNAFIGVLCMVIIGITVFIVGLFLNNMSNRNIFTVAAVLFVLPGAKYLVRFIVMFPYHSVDEERYNKIKEYLDDRMELYTDLVITSSEKVMFLDFIVIGNNQVVGLIGERQDLSYIRKYLGTGVLNWGDDYKVKIVDSEKVFINELKSIEPADVDEEEENNVKSYIMSLIV